MLTRQLHTKKKKKSPGMTSPSMYDWSTLLSAASTIRDLKVKPVSVNLALTREHAQLLVVDCVKSGVVEKVLPWGWREI